jgi:dTDP-4-dehydrorhamnose 3,5-epimerase
MIFEKTNFHQLVIIKPELNQDVRGIFSRTFCKEEFEENGLDSNIAQCNTSFNNKKGTLRGMHYQIHPHEEIKLVRCTRGSMFDVVIDLRKNSNTYKLWFGITLSANNRFALYIPKGFAHGFVTLEDNTEVLYQMSDFFQPNSAKGVRWNDESFKIDWPVDVSIISNKDKSYSNFEE